MAPTLPSLRSEVFKPCVEDKDLAFCLNEGECSIIETVAGVHRHCRWVLTLVCIWGIWFHLSTDVLSLCPSPPSINLGVFFIPAAIFSPKHTNCVLWVMKRVVQMHLKRTAIITQTTNWRIRDVLAALEAAHSLILIMKLHKWKEMFPCKFN